MSRTRSLSSDASSNHIDRIDRTIAALVAERERLADLFAGAPDADPDEAAYQGAPGAFSEDAARALLGGAARLRACATLDDVFGALARGAVRSAVVPIENTLAGPVPGCADLLAGPALRIVAERVQPIDHALIGIPGAGIAEIRSVRSHPVALAQCARYLRRHPSMAPVAAFDTAGAVAEVIASGARDRAAIASRRAAALYGGAVLADAIQDRAGNFTRFVQVERGEADTVWTKGRKTSLVCVLDHEPGALARALAPLAARGLNICRIESRPSDETPFEYVFHLDIGAVAEPDRLAGALDDLRSQTRSLRVLGHYPPDDRDSPSGNRGGNPTAEPSRK